MLKLPGFYKMSKEQQCAVTHGEGPALVVAGPGSGKTFTITHRILYLICEMGIAPQDIYVITFTRDAALSMNKRYQKILSGMEVPGNLNAVHFGTFHSFFYQIIRSHPKYKTYEPISATAKGAVLFRVLEKCGKEMPHGKELQSLFADISYYKNTGDLPKGWEEDFTELVEAYDAEKDGVKMLDYDDMLTLCYKLLSEDEELRRHWQEQIGYLLVDEFQDTNIVQYRVMKLLAGNRANVCVVGDDDQAIYGFRGSDPGIMKKFLEDFPKAVLHRLGTNFRCAEAVVKASSALISHNNKRLSKDLRAVLQGGQVRVREFESNRQMTCQCMEELKMLSQEELEDTAILFRTNMRMSLFITELIKERIPFRTKEKMVSVYEHFVVRDMMDYLRAAYGNRERGLFLRILNKPRTHVGREALLSEQVDFEEIKRFYGKGGCGNAVALRDAERVQKGLENVRKLKFSLGIDFIRHYFGYDTYLRRKAAGDMELYEQWIELLEWLKEDGKSFSTLEDWLRFQAEYIAKSGKRKEEEKNGVNIMTLHGCKGLEFTNVYIMYVNEGNIPAIRRGEKEQEENIEEERRLLYVGMTRAKKVLHILCVKSTQKNARPPSRFIKELVD